MNALPEKKKENHFKKDDSISGLYTDFYQNIKNDKLPAYGLVVMDIIEPYLQDFSNRNGDRSLEILDMWYQTEEYGGSHGLHNHGNNGWSSVIYVDFNPQVHTATRFFSPFNNAWNGELVESIPQVEEGDMIVFPSMIAHEALPNQSRIPRTAISYNIMGDNDASKYQVRKDK